MGYFSRMEALVDDIFCNEKLSCEEQRKALITLLANVHAAGSLEAVEEVQGRYTYDDRDDDVTDSEHLDIVASFVNDASFEFMCERAEELNQLLKGTGITWDGSSVGTKQWIADNKDVLSADAIARSWPKYSPTSDILDELREGAIMSKCQAQELKSRFRRSNAAHRTDIAPSDVCDNHDMPQGSTWYQIAKSIA